MGIRLGDAPPPDWTFRDIPESHWDELPKVFDEESLDLDRWVSASFVGGLLLPDPPARCDYMPPQLCWKLKTWRRKIWEILQEELARRERAEGGFVSLSKEEDELPGPATLVQMSTADPDPLEQLWAIGWAFLVIGVLLAGSYVVAFFL